MSVYFGLPCPFRIRLVTFQSLSVLHSFAEILIKEIQKESDLSEETAKQLFDVLLKPHKHRHRGATKSGQKGIANGSIDSNQNQADPESPRKADDSKIFGLVTVTLLCLLAPFRISHPVDFIPVF